MKKFTIFPTQNKVLNNLDYYLGVIIILGMIIVGIHENLVKSNAVDLKQTEHVGQGNVFDSFANEKKINATKALMMERISQSFQQQQTDHDMQSLDMLIELAEEQTNIEAKVPISEIMTSHYRTSGKPAS